MNLIPGLAIYIAKVHDLVGIQLVSNEKLIFVMEKGDVYCWHVTK